MLGTIRDLLRYSAWADAEHLRAVGAYPASRADAEIQRRLHHIHFAQSAYLAFWKGLPVEEKGEDLLPSFEELRQSMRRCHEEVERSLERMIAEELPAPLFVPDAGAAGVTVVDVIFQAILHGQYHRGQNAARLRQLGGEPPVTDYTAWVLTGRPAPVW